MHLKKTFTWLIAVHDIHKIPLTQDKFLFLSLKNINVQNLLLVETETW